MPRTRRPSSSSRQQGKQHRLSCSTPAALDPSSTTTTDRSVSTTDSLYATATGSIDRFSRVELQLGSSSAQPSSHMALWCPRTRSFGTCLSSFPTLDQLAAGRPAGASGRARASAGGTAASPYRTATCAASRSHVTHSHWRSHSNLSAYFVGYSCPICFTMHVS